MLQDYKQNKITQNELVKWAKSLLETSLKKGGFLEINRFVIYPFISALSIDDPWESIHKDGIHDFLQILEGNKNMKYACYLKIPVEFQKYPISGILHVLNNYKETEKMSDGDFEILEELINVKDKIIVTNFADFIFCDMVDLLCELPIDSYSESNYNSLYLGSTDIKANDVVGKLVKLLECYNGEKEFRVNLVYQSGVRIINIIT
jgi:hypothetical protein